MRIKFLLASLFLAVTISGHSRPIEIDTLRWDSILREGDIIFHTSKSTQSRAIQIVTRSRYSHMGILMRLKNQWMVLEAIQPVQYSSLTSWINRGKDRHFIVKRLKQRDSILTRSVLRKMYQLGETFIGRDYDIRFLWSDRQMYCSELVWKLYKRCTGLEIGKVQQFHEFDLDHPIAKKLIKDRFQDGLPMTETVISPARMFHSKLLYTVR